MDVEPDATASISTGDKPTVGARRTRKVSRYGSRAKVWHGGAEMTSGGLRKENLEKNKYGRIVSKRRSATMKNR
jgi:hypothetical protein